MSSDTKRSARYGRNLYQITVVNPGDTTTPTILRFCADSITVRDGTLMLAAEVEETDAGETAIELPPAAIFAPGQWLSVILLGWEDEQPLFSLETWRRIEAETSDSEDNQGRNN